MRIENQTRYETAPLRELARRVAQVELDPEKRHRVTVRFKEPHHGVTSDGAIGRCGIGGDRVTIFLPKDSRRLVPAQVAHTLAHEFAHARGMVHSQMRGDPRYSWRGTIGKTWREVVDAAGYLSGLTLTVRPQQPKQRPTDDLKLANAAAHLKAWESRRRRAETGMKKWRAKVRYYEQKIAARTPAPTEEGR